MLIFAYNGLIYSPQLALLNERLATFETAIIVFTVMIILIIAWLIYYISNFILQKRSKEFGMYLLMGMTRRQVSLMFLGEQFVLALLAFAIGCFLGTFAIQIMLIIIIGMFQQDYVLEIGFSMQNLMITALYFIVIFVIEFAREYHSLMKHKIYDLLYSEKKNETIKQNKALSYLYCFLAILCFGIGYVCLKSFLDYIANQGEGGFSHFVIGLSALIFSVYLWFFGISSFLTRYINKRKKIKYRGNTMYVYAQIAGRLRSNRAILATLSILTLSTLIFLCLGIKMDEMQKGGVEVFFPFDINAVGNDDIDVSAIQMYLEEEDIAYHDHMYTTYGMPDVHFSLLDNVANELGYFGSEDGTYMALSDYNALRKLKGKEEIAMKDSEYILLVDRSYKKQVEKYISNELLTIDDKNLSFHSLDIESLGQSRLDIINVIIPDSLVTNGTQNAKIYNVKTEIPSTTKWKEHFEEEFLKDNPRKQNYSFVDVQADWIVETTFSTMLMNLCLYYFAIIFTCVSATILATQQISDSAKQRYSYAMLWRMGVSKKELFALMRRQIAFYFFVPMLVPLLYAFPILHLLNDMFENTYDQTSMIPYFFMSLIFYIGINFGYYLLAYYACKQNIKESL